MRTMWMAAALAIGIGIAGSAAADSVDVVPNAPLPGEPFILRIYGVTGSSFTPFVPYRVELVGHEIQVDGCISSGGFAVPGFYWRSIAVVGLPAGDYSVSVRRAVCKDLAIPYTPWELRSTTSFTVSAEPAPVTSTRIRMWEFYNPTTLEYFMTGDEREIVALHTGRIPGWGPTYQSFDLDAKAGSPMCRFHSTAFPGKAPHFYTVDPAECAAVKANPMWTYEGVVGYAMAPNPLGGCGSGLTLYRAYNDGKFGAPNHRYRAGYPLLDMVMYEGWVDEGAVACLPGP